MTNSADPEQLASTMLAKARYIWVQQDTGSVSNGSSGEQIHIQEKATLSKLFFSLPVRGLLYKGIKLFPFGVSPFPEGLMCRKE